MTQEDLKNGRKSLHSIFEDIPAEKLMEIAEITKERVVPEGSVLFEQGEPGDSFYIIKSGKVRIYRRAENGLEIDLSILDSGQSFGEMAILTGQPRSASAQAIEKTHLIVLTKNQFDRVLKDFPDISMQFVRQLADWLRKDEMRLEQEVERRGPSLAWLDFVVIMVISLLCGIIFNQANPNGINLFEKRLPNIAGFMVDSETIGKRFGGEKVLFIDARPSHFFDERHIRGAVNIPYALFDIMFMVHMEDINAADHIIVYGKTISRLYDEKVTQRLDLYGFKNVKILSGGLTEWVKKGYPTEP
jgi:rhodanese-related sulfurtransferase